MSEFLTALRVVCAWAGGFILCAIALYILVRLASFAVYKSRRQAYEDQTNKQGGSNDGKQLGRQDEE